MADAIVSVVAELLVSTVKEQLENEIRLVRGVDKELLDLSQELKTIRNVLDDADRKQFTEKTVKAWLWRLEQTSYEMEDVLEEWNYAIGKHKIESESDSAAHPKQKVCSFIPSSCFCFKKLAVRHDIAKKIQDLKSRLDKILKEKDEYKFVISQPKSDPSPASSWRVQSTSLIDLAQVQGRSEDRDNLVSKLSGSHEGSGYHILSLVGGGGLGKTTLAQLVYNHPQIQDCFDHRIWICVSDPFDVAAIAKGIFKRIDQNSSPDETQLDALLNDLKGKISGKKILLVLDDVWNRKSFADKWERLENALKCDGANGKILVTTRDETVAEIMGTIDEDILRPGLLSDEDCWLLLSRSAALSKKRDPKRFEETGKGIAKKCKGLPLAAKTLGSLLRSKNTPEEWESILKSEMWEMEQVEVELFPHLLLSYHELSPTLKQCFSCCAIFPKDENIKVDKLIRLWMALGYLGSNIGSSRDDVEHEGRKYFKDLAMRSLFQDFEKDDVTEQIISCKMHDIVHDFAQFVRKGPEMTMSACQVCSGSTDLVFGVREYRGLFWDEETPLNICDCLTSLRVLKIRKALNGSPRGLKKLIHLRWLDMSDTKLSKKDLQDTICKLYFLQTLLLKRCSIKEIPGEIGNLVHLRHLNLGGNKEVKELPESMCSLLELQTLLLKGCSLKEIPGEIGNLVHLRHLDLRFNDELKELPESMFCLLELQSLSLASCSLKEIPGEIGNLVHLRHLDLRSNGELKELPESMCSLLELQTLDIKSCSDLRLPEGVAQLTDLRTLDGDFKGGNGRNKLGLLKNLNRLTGSLRLYINYNSSDLEELVEDAQQAELRNKDDLKSLEIWFWNDDSEMDENEKRSASSLLVDVIEALEPNHNLQQLKIVSYKGSRLPHWISLPLNLVRDIRLHECSELSSLPPMGKLPFLESLYLYGLDELKLVGGEWLGIRGGEEVMKKDIIPSSSSSATNVVVSAFPKLKRLTFFGCSKWEEWEDITAEEEESAAVSIMPSLTHLMIDCKRLKMLPHRLLRKAQSLKVLDIYRSAELINSYGDNYKDDTSAWRSISQIHPQLQLVI